MPRKKLPIFHKFSKIFKVSILVAKMRKPVIPRLVLFRKSQKLRKLKLLQNRHYNKYGFITEYEFSPSKSRRLIRDYQRKEFKLSHGSFQRVYYSMLFLCRCLQAQLDAGDAGDFSLQLEALPAVDHEDHVKSEALFKPLDWGGDDDDGEGEDSIDLRAERFIEKFYEEMRLQREASL